MTEHAQSDPADEERQRATAAVLPVLASLDQQAAALQQATDRGEQINRSAVVAYELHAQHAKHLLGAHALSASDIKAAAHEHRGAGPHGFADRALDHATHPRHYEPTPPHQPQSDVDQDAEKEQEIDL
ncbi:hypothetical protein ACFOSC_27895 [Streptantibioticus rubrisoli]|uniref:Uncharacterized protein n=1 Tax=Streptantibioticus rubrisoli TaxID=1387313 RepID=A0ABT1PNG6_9ACTN|nr:hypothetical protein [Streptantibioticus rubrisoli]MCQ4045825.1 hypothetical protein [Streptantibioticus rubrisoli]